MDERRVVALVNPRSGLRWSFSALRREMDRFWDVPGTDLSYQFCQSIEDGIAKARRAVANKVDVVLAVGGDGTVSTIGRELVGSATSLGVVPLGSGNGFARHFGIPLSAPGAVKALAGAVPELIDVGVAAGTPFLVTCSMAWDASIVRSFQKMPIRGSLPYLLAGVYEFFEFEPQPIRLRLDSGEELEFPDPLVFTVANLTEYGGGARIAPHAKHNDGCLELVVARRRDLPKLLNNIGRLYDGTLSEIPELTLRTFRSMSMERERASPIQIDGELVEAPAVIEVGVLPGALKVLVPRAKEVA